MTTIHPAREIPISGGHFAIVDASDYDRVAIHRWYKLTRNGSVYAIRTLPKPTGGTQYMSRFVLDAPVGFDVDHRNGNTLDNRRENLRLCTRSQNNANMRKTRGRSRFKGVSWDAGQSRWLVQIRVNGRVRKVGRFASEEDAGRAYDQEARKTFGEFACLNFPMPGERSCLA